MNEQGFDAGLYRAQRWRAVRRWSLLLGSLLLFVEWHGVPYLRTQWEGADRQRMSTARYWSVTGGRVERVNGIAPLIALFPLERSVVSYGKEALEDLLSHLER